MCHDDKGQHFIIILVVFKSLALHCIVSKGDIWGEKGVVSFEFEMFVDKNGII